ncbi:MAG: hypothetical protein V5A39_01850 [Haloarculaceae archaeon]
MLRALWRRLRDWQSREDGSPFAGSLLDRSVDTAHGIAQEEADRELEQVSEEAEKLADTRRER